MDPPVFEQNQNQEWNTVNAIGEQNDGDDDTGMNDYDKEEIDSGSDKYMNEEPRVNKQNLNTISPEIREANSMQKLLNDSRDL